MKEIVSNYITFFIAIIGLLGGGYWAFSSNWEIEPIIIFTASFIEIVGFLIIRVIDVNKEEQAISPKTDNSVNQKIVNKSKVNKQINVSKNEGKIEM